MSVEFSHRDKEIPQPSCPKPEIAITPFSDAEAQHPLQSAEVTEASAEHTKLFRYGARIGIIESAATPEPREPAYSPVEFVVPDYPDVILDDTVLKH